MINGVQFVGFILEKDMTAFTVCVVDEYVKKHDRLEQVLIFHSEIKVMIFNVVVNILLQRAAPMRTIFAHNCDRNNMKTELLAQQVSRDLTLRKCQVEAPVLDISIPRRIKPSFGGVPYSTLQSGWIQVDGRRVAAAPAHSPRLADGMAHELIARLVDGRFPLRLPLQPLSPRPSLIPLEA